MDASMNRNKIADNNKSIVRAIDNTGVRMFLYFPQTRTITIPENTCAVYQCKEIYTDMPDSFADDFVYLADYDGFKAMYYDIDRGVASASAIFHSKDLKYCHHVTLTTVSWCEDGRPESALGIIENITDEMKTVALLQDLEDKLNRKAIDDFESQKSISQVAAAIGDLFYAIYHIRLSDDSFICFRENNVDLRTMIGDRGVYSSGWKSYVEKFIPDAYRDAVSKFGENIELINSLNNTDMISMSYQRKEVGWVKATFIVAERNPEGEAATVILTVADINDEVRLEEQRKVAQFEAEHDPLTGLYNRNGFTRITASREFQLNPTGFMLIDIDNFKALNDCYGHEIGDSVLIDVALQLTQIFRSEDKIFRLGGDEIAVLLSNCDAGVWDIICSKISSIHSSLMNEYSDGPNVSLSVGVCFSKSGYREELYLLADEALYTTKKNGRAGCTLINENHEILKSWSDDAIPFHSEHVLEYTTSGMFRMEIPEDSHLERRIVCGDSVKTAFGADADATPEECYEVWEKGVAPEYRTVVREAMERMVSRGHGECTYVWRHPQWGETYVRSNAFGEIQDGIIILTGIHHVLKDTNLVEKKDDLELLNASMSDLFFAAYYWDLENDQYSTVKASYNEEYVKMGDQRTSVKLEEFISYMVEQTDRQKVRKFLDTANMQGRIGDEAFIVCKYRSVNHEEEMQLRLIPVKYNLERQLTNVLLVILLLGSSPEKGQYLKDFDRKSLTSLYNTVPAGIVMYEWNGEKLKTVHISEYYAREYGYSLNSEEGDNIGGPDFKRVHPDDVEGYKKAIHNALVNTNSLQYTYRVWNQATNQYLWVKVDAVSKPQPDGTSLVYAVYTDVTEQNIAQQRLEKSNVAILSALESTEQYIYEYDPVEQTSTCFTETSNGYDLDHVIEKYPECFRHNDFMHPDDVELFIDTVREFEQGAESAHCEVRVRKEGKEHWHSCTFHPFYDPEKGYTIGILTVIDTTSSKSMIQKHTDLMKMWKFESEHDRLTGLLNRDAVFRKCRALLEEYPEEQFVMVHCDIRHFHLYNTFFGEEAGDQLLCSIAGLIDTMFMDYDYGAYGRIESDVFCAFFPVNHGYFEKHMHFFFRELEKIRDDFPIAPAIGAYWVTDSSMAVESMFSRATIAAKSGKINLYGLISRFDEDMSQNLKEAHMVTNEMNRAITDEEFKVFLQPKYSMRSGKIVGAEALARWQHPERGMISPAVFIPVFEKNGFITDLDYYILERVCRMLRRWKDEKRPMCPVSVNISRASMYNRVTVPFLKSLVEKYDIEPEYLELELTETAYMDDPDELKGMLKELQTFGFKILMDDFGSGYSSLNTLRELPVDILKLDMKFLSELQGDKRGLAVLASIVRMSKLINLPIVAEGVEEQNQANYLRNIGCEYAQGFLFARPMPIADFEELLETCDSNKDNRMTISKNHIADMLADQDSMANSIGEAFPSPLAMIEYENESFKILRTNKKFLKQFGLIDDLRPASLILKEKLDSHSYDVLIKSIKEAVTQDSSVSFVINWPGNEGLERLAGCIDYEETVDRTDYLMLTIINMQQVIE